MLDRNTLVAVAAKRVRERRYTAFGDLIKKWRGERDIEDVVRHVNNIGVDFDGATLRGWEYGWSGRPDPLRLLALAHVYGRTSMDVLRALAIARNIHLPSDLIDHSGATRLLPTSSGSGGGGTPASRDRIADLRGELAIYKAVVRRAHRLTKEAYRVLGGEGGPTRPPQSKGRRTA